MAGCRGLEGAGDGVREEQKVARERRGGRIRAAVATKGVEGVCAGGTRKHYSTEKCCPSVQAITALIKCCPPAQVTAAHLCNGTLLTSRVSSAFLTYLQLKPGRLLK